MSFPFLKCHQVTLYRRRCTQRGSSVSSDPATLQLEFLCQYEALKFQACSKKSFTNFHFVNKYSFYFQTAWWYCFENWGVATWRCARTTAEKLSTSWLRSHLSTTTLAGSSHILAELTLNWLNTHRYHPTHSWLVCTLTFGSDQMCRGCRQSVCSVRFAGSSRTELKEWRFIPPLCGTCRRMLPCLLSPKTWPTWTRTVLR